MKILTIIKIIGTTYLVCSCQNEEDQILNSDKKDEIVQIYNKNITNSNFFVIADFSDSELKIISVKSLKNEGITNEILSKVERSLKEDFDGEGLCSFYFSDDYGQLGKYTIVLAEVEIIKQ